MKPTFYDYKDYFSRNFGNGRTLYQFFRDQIATDMAQYGIIWGAVEPELPWIPGKAGRVQLNQRRFLKKGTKTHSVHADYKQLGDIEYFVITLSTKGDTQAIYTFDAWSELKMLVESERGVSDLSEQRKAKLASKAEQARQRELAAKREAEIERARRERERVKDVAHFMTLPPLTESGYLDKKKLRGILPHCPDLRRGKDKRGSYTAIPLYSMTGRSLSDPGEVVGVQRIYDTPFTRSTGETTDKDFTFGLDKSVVFAHAQIGTDLLLADTIYCGTGWATCASTYLAHQNHLTGKRGNASVLVCLDDGQLKLVVEQLLTRWPWIQDRLCIVLDNDRFKQAEGKGNSGLAAGHHLLSLFPKLRCQYPDLTEADSKPDGTDFDDLRQGHRLGLKAVADQLHLGTHRLMAINDPFLRTLRGMTYSTLPSLQSLAEQAARCGADSFPLQRSRDMVRLEMNEVVNAHPWMKLDWQKVANVFDRQVSYRRHRAHSFRSFGPRITRAKLRPDHIHYHRYDDTEITPAIQADIDQMKGMIILRAGMGSGKTQRVIKPAMWIAEKGATFSHRVSLVGASHTMLTTRAKDGSEDHIPSHQMEIFHYHERESFRDMGVKKLVACINSIGKEVFTPILNRLDLLAIDEAAQTIKAITSGGVMKYPLTVFNRLKQVAANASQVLLVDADANDELVRFAEQVRDMRGDGLPIHIIELATDCSHLTVLHGEINAIYADIVQQVGAGQRVLVADDSAEEGQKLASDLMLAYPDKKGLFISQDSKTHDKAVQKFNDKPNKEIVHYDWVIYSPAISSGVSIEVPHMQLHYGLFRGVVSPSDAVQMIRRDRTARQFILGLGSQNGYKMADEQAHWRATLSAMAEQADGIEIHYDQQTGRVEVASGDLAFDQLRIRQICQENMARNDFGNVLLLQLMADRYQVRPIGLENAGAMAKMGEAMKKAAGQRLAQLDAERILAAPTPTDERKEKLVKETHITQQEKAELDRWNIERFLQSQVNEESIRWLRNGGMSHAKRFELLQMDLNRAQRLDEQEVKLGMPISTRSFIAHSSTLLQRYFTTCGIDLQQGTGTVTQEAMQAAMEQLYTEADFLNHYASWAPQLKKRKRGADLFKAICENLNLCAGKARLPRSQGGETVWHITPDSWQLMMDVHQARIEWGISSFEEYRLRVSVRPVRLLLGVGCRILTMQTLSPEKANSSALRPLREGIYATPAMTIWRTSPAAVPLAEQPPHTLIVADLIRLGRGAKAPVPDLRIHDFADDLIEQGMIVDPQGSAGGSGLGDVTALIRGAAEAVNVGVKEVFNLLTSADRNDLSIGQFSLDELIDYVRGCLDPQRAVSEQFGMGMSRWRRAKDRLYRVNKMAIEAK